MDDRDSILTYARDLVPEEGLGDPVKVAAAALPLLEWAEGATDKDDLRARMRALRHQHYGLCGSGRDSAPAESAPAEFVDAAGVLYAFLVAGRETGHAEDEINVLLDEYLKAEGP